MDISLLEVRSLEGKSINHLLEQLHLHTIMEDAAAIIDTEDIIELAAVATMQVGFTKQSNCSENVVLDCHSVKGKNYVLAIAVNRELSLMDYSREEMKMFKLNCRDQGAAVYFNKPLLFIIEGTLYRIPKEDLING